MHCSINVWNYIHSTANAVKLWLNFVTFVYAVWKKSKFQQSKTMHIASCHLQYVCRGSVHVCALGTGTRALWQGVGGSCFGHHIAPLSRTTLGSHARPLHMSFTTLIHFTMAHDNFGQCNFSWPTSFVNPHHHMFKRLTNPNYVVACNASVTMTIKMSSDHGWYDTTLWDTCFGINVFQHKHTLLWFFWYNINIISKWSKFCFYHFIFDL